VRAVVVKPNAPVGSRRHAGDCAPYRRFAATAKMASGRWLRSVHESFLTADFMFFIKPKAAEGRRTPRRWREGCGSRVREASWTAPAPWRFLHGAARPAKLPQPSRRQFPDDFSRSTHILVSCAGAGQNRQRGRRTNSVARDKAAEGRRSPKRWREFYGSCVREASWTAPAPWRFLHGAGRSFEFHLC